MAELFFEKGGAPHPQRTSPIMVPAWKARVEQALGVPIHKIGVNEFKEWDRRGFKKAKEGEYRDFSKAENERLMLKMTGGALRK